MIKITINNKKIKPQENQTILEAAMANGIEVPTLCYHSDLKVKADCRICVVMIKGRTLPVAACSTKVEDDMEIITESPELEKLRKTNLELVFSQHQEECFDCVWESNCSLLKLAKKYNVQITRFQDRKKDFPVYNFDDILIYNSSKCVDCRNCIEACDKQNVHHLKIISQEYLQRVVPEDKNPCIYCGQCLIHCPSGAFEAESEFEKINEPLKDKNKVVIFQIAPSIRTSIGEEFGMPPGTITTNQLTGAIKQLGVNYVFDTSVGADFTTTEEAKELLTKIEKNENHVLFSSCCPSWVRFIEKYYPEFTGNIATSRSPQMMLAGIIKNYWAQKTNIKPENIVLVSVMPCIAKKYEITRPELFIDGQKMIDYVLTTRELAWLLKKHKINFSKVKPEKLDAPFGEPSGAGVIYGASGGVMESALRTAISMMKGVEFLSKKEFGSIRGQQGIKKLKIKLKSNKTIKMAVANGINNAVQLLEELKKDPTAYSCIEVMACPGGCIGGGGQPLPISKTIRQKRADGLYKIDSKTKNKMAHKNPVVKQVYKEFLTTSEIIQKVCHVKYVK